MSKAPAPISPTSSLGVNSSSTPACGLPLLDDPARRLDHRHDRRLVVGAENRPARVPHDPVLAEDRLERALRRHRVEVRAEEDRRAAFGAAGEPAEQVPIVEPIAAPPRLRRRRGRRPQLSGDTVCDVALLPRRARQRAQLGEEVEDGAHRSRS